MAESMPDELKSEISASFTFSQSSLQDYFDCPRRFQLRYIEHLAWPAIETEPVLENEFRQYEGQLFHRMVQQHLVGLPVEKLTRLASKPNLTRWWENYLSQDFNIAGYALYPELTITAPIGSHRLLAKFDLLAILPNQKALIFDWKTTQRRPRDEWMAVRMQTRVYRALLVQAGAALNGGTLVQPEQVDMVYWYADIPAEPAHFPYNPTQFKRDWDGLTSMINEIDHQRYFPLTEDEKKCAYCPFRSYCNRGGKAGMIVDAEEDMEAASPEFKLNFEQIAEIEF
jgi:CRISPR/Cas system-associated exonuclease Cas4 (RecB family)